MRKNLHLSCSFFVPILFQLRLYFRLRSAFLCDLPFHCELLTPVHLATGFLITGRSSGGQCCFSCALLRNRALDNVLSLLWFSALFLTKEIGRVLKNACFLVLRLGSALGSEATKALKSSVCLFGALRVCRLSNR